jgi:hypothetical protein
MKFPGHSRIRARCPDERGYAMLLALSMMMVLLVASMAVIANVRIEGKRQREEEAIWRGNQYIRAIRLFYHKTGHYPRDVQELSKGLPQLHFLRQVYKDPINTTDGAWRFIYTNAAGQLIGSTKYSSLQQMAFADSGGLPGQTPGLVGTPASSLTNSSGFGSVTGGAASNPSQTPSPEQPDPNAPAQEPPNENPDQGEQNSSAPQQPGTPAPAPSGPVAGNQSPFTTLSGQPGNPIDNQKPTGPVDGPVLGGFLTGVASKVDARSQKVYKRGKKYINWEFIWNPLEDAAANMQQTLNPLGQQPGIGQPIGPGAFGQGGNPIGATPTPQPGPPPPQQ